MKALNATLPPMAPKLDPRAPTPDVKTLPFDKRNDLKIEYVETEFFQRIAKFIKVLFIRRKDSTEDHRLNHLKAG